MGFRQPFTLHTDPANPGIVGVGEFAHDASTDNAGRGSAGIVEWNLRQQAGQPRLAVLHGRQLGGRTA